MSQETLGHRADIHPTWISHIESGRINPTWANVRRIAKGLSVPLGQLADAAQLNEKDPLTTTQRSEPIPPAPPKTPPIPEGLITDIDDVYERLGAFRKRLKEASEPKGS